MSRVVLVHGAWHGAWCWRHVAAAVRAAGHEPVTPTLRGVGERSAELHPEIRLDDHVSDVIAALEADEPSVLVGHSYAGLVVREAADRRPELVDRLILVDGWAGGSGSSMFSLAPSWFEDALRAMAVEQGAGWAMPAPPPALVGVTDPGDVAWLEAELTPHPLRTFEDPTILTGAVDGVDGTAILCAQSAGLPFADIARELGYRCATIDSGHDAMVTAPEQLSALLLEAITDER